MTPRRLALLALAALALGAAPKKTPWVPPAPKDAVTHAVAHVDGQSIPYTARAGTITLRNTNEQITARMYYTAFTKSGARSADRPVTFFYNGGPGSSTIWLLMGSFAPMRVQTANDRGIPNPPFHLIPNAYSLIDKSDLVFIDAPNTGFSRVLGAGDPKDFMGVDQDGRAFAQFIERYLTQFGRWNSPKFLYGESYGTTRDCVLANLLQNDGVQINGVVLQSSILNYGLGGGPIAGGDWTYVGYLPTEAATAWFHHKAGRGQTLAAFLKSVEAFDDGAYLHALAKGSTLSAVEYGSVAAKLHEYLGLPESYVRESNLRVPYIRFMQALLRDQDQTTGRYDTRYTTYDLDANMDEPDWDPSDVGIDGAFTALGNQYLRDTLGYKTNLTYRPTSYGGELGARWDMRHEGDDPPVNVTPDLARTMTVNPHLYVYSANGYFDFATPFHTTVYTLQHMGLNPALQKHITFGFYQSGHMIYLNPNALAVYKRNLARWYDHVLANR